jgi:hypothetical protein
VDDLLQKGIAAFKAGNREEARKYFSVAVQQNRDNERLWGWIYNTAVNDTERVYCLKQMLRIDPQNGKALQLLGDLTGSKPVNTQTEKAEPRLQKVDAWLSIQKQDAEQQLSELNKQIELKKKEIIILDDEILFQSFGFYKPHYNLENSEGYKRSLENTQKQQEMMIRENIAIIVSKRLTMNNSEKEGERMIKDFVKLILRSFNNECDASIFNVKFNNIEMIEKRIRKAFDVLNKLGERMSISISGSYLNLKLQEMYLVYEYQIQKQREKEEQKRVREQMREEAKLLKEIEDMKIKVEKEEKHFSKAIEAVTEKIAIAQTETEIKILEIEKEKLEKSLAEAEKNKQDVLNREQNTRAGYVYIISNLGAFGENVYKIGVTRRLDPTERVDELGDASVPFDFDIHAMIFSDDAPALENALHKAFEQKRLNMINRRREFFKVTLDDIEKVVKTNFGKPVEFVKIADAAEYRESLMLKKAAISQQEAF